MLHNVVALVETYIMDHTTALRLGLYKDDPTVKAVVNALLVKENGYTRSALRKWSVGPAQFIVFAQQSNWLRFAIIGHLITPSPHRRLRLLLPSTFNVRNRRALAARLRRASTHVRSFTLVYLVFPFVLLHTRISIFPVLRKLYTRVRPHFTRPGRNILDLTFLRRAFASIPCTTPSPPRTPPGPIPLFPLSRLIHIASDRSAADHLGYPRRRKRPSPAKAGSETSGKKIVSRSVSTGRTSPPVGAFSCGLRSTASSPTALWSRRAPPSKNKFFSSRASSAHMSRRRWSPAGPASLVSTNFATVMTSRSTRACPPVATLLALFVSEARGTCTGSCIRNWLCGLRLWHIYNDAPWFGDDERLALLKKSSVKAGLSFSRPARGPRHPGTPSRLSGGP
ncbi:hypothetical protein B0H14DRAFT_3479554 [Mycena olivaceomarginata]|nr:hypothetical protein B0H14DRAFT_3479554 [Mycena olivaceomarginata]